MNFEDLSASGVTERTCLNRLALINVYHVGVTGMTSIVCTLKVGTMHKHNIVNVHKSYCEMHLALYKNYDKSGYESKQKGFELTAKCSQV